MKPFRLLLALASLFVLAPAPRAFAQCTPGPHAGTITADQTWCAADSPHVLSGHVFVALGATLTVQAGVTVKAGTNVGLIVRGRLVAPGTSASPITFTDNGSGQWTGLGFDGGTGTLSYCTVLRGGNASPMDPYRADIAAHLVPAPGLVLDNCTIEGTLGLGLRVIDSVVSISSSTFTNASSRPLWVQGASTVLSLSGNSFVGNASNRVFLDPDAMSGADFTLTKQAVLDAYELTGHYTVPAGRTMTVAPGVRVVGPTNVGLIVKGRLVAQGTATNPITFSDAGSGEWTGLGFDGGTGTLSYCTVLRGGDASPMDPYRADIAAHLVPSPGLLLDHCTVDGTRGVGMRIADSVVGISDSTFSNARTSALWVQGASTVLSLSRNSFVGNASNRVLIDPGAMSGADFTLAKQTALDAYQLNGHYFVPPGRTMTVAPGVKVVGTTNVGLVVQGRLVARGTAAEPITFSDAGTGQWTGLAFDGGTGDLAHCTVARGGNASPIDPYRGNVAARNVQSGIVLMENCRLTEGALGLRLFNSRVTTDALTVDGMSQWPVLVEGATTVLAMTNATIDLNTNNRVYLVDGAMMAADATLRAQTKLEGYQLGGSFHVPVGVTLSVEPGVTVMAGTNEGLYVRGRLEAVGTPSSPVVFRSTGTMWTGVAFDGGSGLLRHAVVMQGGNGSEIDPWRGSVAIRDLETGELRIENSQISSANAWGVTASDSRVTLVNTVVRNNGADGIRATNGAFLTVRHATFVANGAAVRCVLGSTCTLTNTIVSASPNGVVNDGSSTVTLSHTLWDGVGTPTSGPVTDQGSITGPAALAADGIHLTSASLALEQGTPTADVDDFDDELRPQPAGTLPDLGADEAAWAAPLGRTATPIALGETKNGTTPASGFSDFVLNLASGAVQNLQVRLVAPGGVANVRLLARNRQFPMPALFDAAGTATDSTTLDLLVPLPASGDWYLSASSSGGAVPFTITVAGVTRAVAAIDPSSGGNAGTVTAIVDGAGFEPDVRVELRAAGVPLLSALPSGQNPWHLSVRLALAGLLPQLHDVCVVWPDGEEKCLPAAFRVLAGGSWAIEAHLKIPDALRGGRGTTGFIEYENTGTVDTDAPLFIVASDQNAPMRHDALEPWVRQPVQLLGIGDAMGSAGILSPGRKHRVSFEILSEGPAHALLTFTLSVLSSAAAARPLDWPSLEATFKPEGIDPQAWARIWPLITQSIGPTWGDYHLMLRRNASTLSGLGRMVSKPSTLFGVAVDQALITGPQESLASGVDAVCPAPGLPLTFGRSFANGPLGRATIGALGVGWTHTYDLTLVTLSSGNREVRSNDGTIRSFRLLSGGGFAAMAGDHGRLIVSGSTARIVERNGLTTTFLPDGRVASLSDAHGNRIDAAYDGSGRLVSATHTSGDRLLFDYDGSGRLVRMTDHAGQTTVYAYDGASRRLVQVTAPGGHVTHYTYKETSPDADSLVSIAFPDGSHVFYQYDASGRLVAHQRDVGPVTRFSRDATGRIAVGVAAARGRQDDLGGAMVAGATLSLDELGRVGEVTDELGNVVALAYGADEELASVVDPLGGLTTIEHGPLGEVTSLDQPGGVQTRQSYGYPVSGGRFAKSLIDPNGNVSTFTLDAGNKVTSITYPGGGQEALERDPQGNVTTFTNRRGQTIRFAYNARGQVTQKWLPGGESVSYGYDALARLTTVTDASGNTQLAYDAGGFLARVTYPSGKWFAYLHDDVGRPTRRTGDDGYVLSWQYDASGRLTRVTRNAGELVIAYQYDTLGRLGREDRGNGTATTYEWDAASRLVSLTHLAPGGGPLASYAYTYDAAGHVTSATTPDGIWTFAYDAVGRLVSEREPSGILTSYRYDDAGNRVQVDTNGVVVAWTVNGQNQITQAGTTSYTWDADGNLATRTTPSGTTSFTWNSENRLTQVAGALETAAFAYNAFGQPASQTVGGVTSSFVHDVTSATAAAATVLGAAGQLAARYDEAAGLAAAVDAAGTASSYHFDGVGNTARVTDPSGAATNAYSYDANGNVTSSTGPATNPFTTGGSDGTSSTGGGLLAGNTVPYDPIAGKWATKNDSGYSGGANLYTKWNNDPVKPAGPPKTLSDYGATVAEKTFNAALKLAAQSPEETGVPTLGTIAGGTFNSISGIRQVYDASERHDSLGVIEGLGNSALGDLEILSAVFPPLAAPVKVAQVIAVGGKTACNLYVANLAPNRDPNWFKPVAHNYWYYYNRNHANDPVPPDQRLVERTPGKDQVFPGDPNEKDATPGTGSRHYVRAGSRIFYTVYFENVPTASAPAQEVFVTDLLDPSLDAASLELVDAGWADTTLVAPAGATTWSERTAIADWRAGNLKPWWVDLDVTASPAGNLAWTFRTLDPETGDLPSDALAGFLPPNDATGRGKGWVSLSVKTKAPLAPGTRIENSASIVFDTNAPIRTNATFHTIGLPGDVNDDGVVNPADVFYLVNHFYSAGPAPLGVADVNFDGHVDALDLFYLINYLFAGGPAPE